MKTIHWPALLILAGSLLLGYILLNGLHVEFFNAGQISSTLDQMEDGISSMTFSASPEMGSVAVILIFFVCVAFLKHRKEKGSLVILTLGILLVLVVFSSSLTDWVTHVQSNNTNEAFIGLILWLFVIGGAVIAVRTQSPAVLLLGSIFLLVLVVGFGSYEGEPGLFYQAYPN